MKNYTVLLKLPDTIAKGSTPWDDTFLVQVTATDKNKAVYLARKQAADLHDYNGDLKDYAVLFVALGVVKDISDETE